MIVLADPNATTRLHGNGSTVSRSQGLADPHVGIHRSGTIEANGGFFVGAVNVAAGRTSDAFAITTQTAHTRFRVAGSEFGA